MMVGQEQSQQAGGGFREVLMVIVHALILALIVRTFLYQPFNIPSGSMRPTLLIGDYLLVSKFSYGFSKHSFPLSLPLFDDRVWYEQPKRGDVAVFKLPRDNKTDYIKRVIGLPGDRVQMREGVLYLNGDAVPKQRLADFRLIDGDGRERMLPRYKETLPNGVSYEVLDTVSNGFADTTPVFTVPPGHFFMLGDNRDNSADSRVMSAVGFVPKENLIGRAELLFFSIQPDARFWQIWRWPTSVRWGRLFTVVR